jgi:fumarate hydratase class II
MEKVRIEHDTLGEVKVPTGAYYGAQTVRALNNFPISGQRPSKEYVVAVVIIKKAASVANHRLGLMERQKSDAIVRACDEILGGKFLDQFVVDPYQAGAGTSHNMNVNEVIANRANEILGAPLGSYKFIHPNDDVNMSQSTNDVIPTAIRLMVLGMSAGLLENVFLLHKSFSKKADELMKIVKTGRTHMQDALPVTLGQEFGAYAVALRNDMDRIERANMNLFKIGIGGTGVGTGVNTHRDYHGQMVLELSKLRDKKLKSNGNLFESMQNAGDLLEYSSACRSLAGTIIRIGNDLRLLSSGPRSGLSEIMLPKVQPGSSLMPGKVNPSIIEMMTMVCYQVIGYDQACLLAMMSGQLELNVYLPLLAYDLQEETRLLTNGLKVFKEKCVDGIQANEEMCAYWFERSSGIAAILNRYLGYEKTAELVRYALEMDISIKEAVLKKKFLSEDKVEEIFKIENLTGLV